MRTLSQNMDLYRLHSPRRSTASRDQYRVVNVTKDQIERQLAAVIELRELNAAFLENAEKAWIASAIERAAASLDDDAGWDDLMLERPNHGRSWLLNSRTKKQPTPRDRAQIPTSDELQILLNTAKSLNAVMHLLSCCYERWMWLQSTKVTNGNLSRMSTDSREFLKRRKHGYKQPDISLESSESQLFHCSTDESTSPDISRNVEPPEHLLREEDSDTQLSFFVIDTIGKWRQDAEDALTATTQRYQGRIPSVRLREHRTEASRIGTVVRSSGASARLPTCTHSSLHQIPNESNLTTTTSKPARWSTMNTGLSEEMMNSCNLKQQSDPTSINEHQPTCAYNFHEHLRCHSTGSALDNSATISPYHANLKNSFGKEPFSRVSLESALLVPIQNSGLGLPLPSISSPSSSSSAIFSQSTNLSTTSFESKTAGNGQVRVSRGRAWLQSRSESNE